MSRGRLYQYYGREAEVGTKLLLGQKLLTTHNSVPPIHNYIFQVFVPRNNDPAVLNVPILVDKSSQLRNFSVVHWPYVDTSTWIKRAERHIAVCLCVLLKKFSDGSSVIKNISQIMIDTVYRWFEKVLKCKHTDKDRYSVSVG